MYDLNLNLQTVDRDRSGKITADELRQALLNNNWSHFNPETCRLMIGMFDKDQWVITLIYSKDGGRVGAGVRENQFFIIMLNDGGRK